MSLRKCRGTMSNDCELHAILSCQRSCGYEAASERAHVKFLKTSLQLSKTLQPPSVRSQKAGAEAVAASYVPAVFRRAASTSIAHRAITSRGILFWCLDFDSKCHIRTPGQTELASAEVSPSRQAGRTATAAQPPVDYRPQDATRPKV